MRKKKKRKRPLTVLEEAALLTEGVRQRDYDHPGPNHWRISRLWNAYLSIRKNPTDGISPLDVAWMMVLLKIARDVYTPKRDNLVDACGYVRCIERMMGSMKVPGYVDVALGYIRARVAGADRKRRRKAGRLKPIGYHTIPGCVIEKAAIR